MSLTYKFSYSLIFCVLLTALILPANNSQASVVSVNFSDSTSHKPKIREVLTSQQLFVVEVSPIKGAKANEERVNFKAELRDAFMIIGYDDNSSTKELNWTMCPDGKCPEVGTFQSGTKEYAKLDSLITKFKPLSQPE